MNYITKENAEIALQYLQWLKEGKLQWLSEDGEWVEAFSYCLGYPTTKYRKKPTIETFPKYLLWIKEQNSTKSPMIHKDFDNENDCVKRQRELNKTFPYHFTYIQKITLYWPNN